MKRDLHNLNLGFIQIKRNVHFDSTDHEWMNVFVFCGALQLVGYGAPGQNT